MIDLKKGTKITSKNTYTILHDRPIGEGNYSKVYLARHEGLGRQVALKFLKRGREALRELRKEAWFQGKLNHPNIVYVYGCDEDLGLLITEYLPNSLEKYRVEQGTIPLDMCIKILGDCFRALDHAHGEGVVHGDVKPGNILLDKHHNAKMSDFGVSKLLGMAPGTDPGSARWAAPEVLDLWNNEHIWAPEYKSDLFSMGVVAYLVLTGKHPFYDPSARFSPEDLILKEDFVPSPPSRDDTRIPARVVEVVMRLLEKDKKLRYSEAHDVLTDLGEPIDLVPADSIFHQLPETITNSVRKVAEGYQSLNGKNELLNDFVTSKIINLGAEAERWKSGMVHTPAENIETKGIAIFQQLRIGGFSTFLVSRLKDFWDAASRYYEICREIAHDKKITRVFICEDAQSLENTALLKHISADENAGIETRIAFSEDITDINAVKDFGIWDEKVLCIVEKEAIKGGLVGCDFYFSDAALEQGRHWKKTVIDCSRPSKEVLLEKLSTLTRANPTLLDLSDSAPVMKGLADRLCKGSYLDHGSCVWYHGSWQYLRLLDLVSTPDWHNDFYRGSISRLFAGRKQISILISGLADYGMLSHVLDGCRAARTEPRILVIDSCETPLEICEYYVQKHPSSPKIETKKADVISFRFPHEHFDLIVTDAFLTRFTISDRATVVSNWKQALRPKGAILTTIRIDKNHHKYPVVTTRKDVRSFKERAWSTAIERAGLLLSELADERVKQMAEQYATKIISYPFETEQEIRELFRDFDLDLRIVNTKGELRLVRYAEVVCRKSH
jgi:serine/threonine protein kinase/SAM-dependent methyltransferase